MTYYEIYAELDDFRTIANSFKEALNEIMHYTQENIWKEEDQWIAQPFNNNRYEDDRTRYFKTRKALLENLKIRTGYYIKRIG